MQVFFGDLRQELIKVGNSGGGSRENLAPVVDGHLNRRFRPEVQFTPKGARNTTGQTVFPSVEPRSQSEVVIKAETGVSRPPRRNVLLVTGRSPRARRTSQVQSRGRREPIGAPHL